MKLLFRLVRNHKATGGSSNSKRYKTKEIEQFSSFNLGELASRQKKELILFVQEF
jgi:hypothetical protein